ncbi:MAG: hypothetical protein ACKOX6_07500 [Bdellovibrio sp.]
MLKSTAKIAMASYLLVAMAGLSGCATPWKSEPDPRQPSSYDEEMSAKPSWDSKFYRYVVPGKSNYY